MKKVINLLIEKIIELCLTALFSIVVLALLGASLYLVLTKGFVGLVAVVFVFALLRMFARCAY